MKRLLVRTLLCLVPMLLFPRFAEAQLFRAYVASFGNDANPCTVSQPCRLLPAAIAAVAADGEIWMLDSANFNQGTVNVTKAVTIMAVPGQVGSIVAVNNAPAMTVSGTVVTLRNVAITTNAANPGADGIDVTNGFLKVIDSFFHITDPATASWGIKATGGSAASTVTIRNTRFVNMINGILVQGNAKLDISDSTFDQIYYTAIQARGNQSGYIASVNVRNCSIASAYFAGVYASGDVSGGIARAYVFDSTFDMNGTAVVSAVGASGATASLTLGGSQITQSSVNPYYQSGAGATLYTMGNNVMRDNVSGTPGTLTSATFQ